MWKLSGFADEASSDLDEQIALLNKLGIKHIEFRSAWGIKVLDLTQEQLEEAKAKLDAAGIKLSSVGSDIGKIFINEPFEDHLKRAAHAVEVAKFFGCDYIRMFSFFIPQGEDPAQYRGEVMDRSRAFVRLAEAGGVTMLHENEKDIYGDIPERVVDLITEMDSPHYRGIFDPANYVQCGAKPVDEAYPLVKDFTHYLHVKDASATEFDANGHSKVVPAGHGDGQFPELIAALKADGYEGFLSIEPHLGDFNAFGGLCGPDLWTDAYNAITKILSDQDIAWQ
ncbi:sugar phosphate isomerase/epimerase [Propioniciclava sinopodophylli]|uniref:Sugar phosphate isomerase/epimerase n=1 Tax=Propioniciclava sinopodophylli TaxID=1837344 RepID=A0A4Q9KBK8_9ACTN|nr:sugar phosphate isomerase/epimerase family protein [Propioniciclava sinopodophylli]TBT82670.1 sugar phosphate isomerase/epimerase [Propioniciclava sinopodophylli]